MIYSVEPHTLFTSPGATNCCVCESDPIAGWLHFTKDSKPGDKPASYLIYSMEPHTLFTLPGATNCCDCESDSMAGWLHFATDSKPGDKPASYPIYSVEPHGRPNPTGTSKRYLPKVCTSCCLELIACALDETNQSPWWSCMAGRTPLAPPKRYLPKVRV